MNDILVYFAIKYKGDWDSIYSAINKKERVDSEEVKRVVSECNFQYITLLDSNYPQRLKNIYKPPFVLFYIGDVDLLNYHGKSIAVVGSRKCSDYGIKNTQNLVKELTGNNCLIVSGLASGIDAIAHQTCLDNNGKTIAVLANGLDIYYPELNKELQDKISTLGLVVSEYPPSIIASQDSFPKRNRIVAGLSDGVLVTEAKSKSGSMITVSRALEMGKEIFTIPYSLDYKDSGCNNLIKEGAKLVESALDILNEL